MVSSFTLATKNKVLSKDEQLTLWKRFNYIPTKLKHYNLPVNLKSLPLLKEKLNPQELKLLHLGLRARDRLVFGNQALVIKEANKYANEAIGLEEMIQIGNVGLMTALLKFKPGKNTKFSTYAYFWIRAAIFETLYRVDPIYIPVKIRSEMQAFTYVSVQEEDRIKEFSNSDRPTATTINQIMQHMDADSQEMVSEAFGLDENYTLLTVALTNGISFEEARDRVNEILKEAKEAYESASE